MYSELDLLDLFFVTCVTCSVVPGSKSVVVGKDQKPKVFYYLLFLYETSLGFCPSLPRPPLLRVVSVTGPFTTTTSSTNFLESIEGTFSLTDSSDVVHLSKVPEN